MDWSAAIERNRTALLRILAGMTILLRFSRPGMALLPRALKRYVAGIVGTAEAATRFLIIAATHGMARDRVDLAPRPAHHGPGRDAAKPDRDAGIGRPLSAIAQLMEIERAAPWKRRGGNPPRPAQFPDRGRPAALPDQLSDTGRLALRMARMRHVLFDLPAAANRLLRQRARRLGQRGARTTVRSGPDAALAAVAECDKVLLLVLRLAGHSPAHFDTS